MSVSTERKRNYRMDKPQLYPRNYRTLGSLVEREFSDRVKATAKAEGTNVSRLIYELLSEYLENRETVQKI